MAENNATETSQDSAPEPAKEATSNAEETTASTTGDVKSDAPEFTDLGQKVVDIALGALVVSGELTVQAAKLLVERGPEIVDTLEAKGRPVREQIDEWLKSGLSRPFQEAASTDSATKPEKTETASADEEISALERRVRELEDQVSGKAPVIDVPSVPTPVLPDLEDIAPPVPETGAETSAPPTDNAAGNDTKSI